MFSSTSSDGISLEEVLNSRNIDSNVNLNKILENRSTSLVSNSQESSPEKVTDTHDDQYKK